MSNQEQAASPTLSKVTFTPPSLPNSSKEKNGNFAGALSSSNEPIMENTMAQDEFINMMPIGLNEDVLIKLCVEFNAFTLANRKFLKMMFVRYFKAHCLPYV